MFMLKAIIAGIVAAGGSLGTGFADGHLTIPELIIAVVTTATAVGAVFGVSNTPTKPAG